MPNSRQLARGNYLLSHSGLEPQLFEITPDKRVVGSYANHADARTIAAVQRLGS